MEFDELHWLINIPFRKVKLESMQIKAIESGDSNVHLIQSTDNFL